jgi:hypothetical protein
MGGNISLAAEPHHDGCGLLWLVLDHLPVLCLHLEEALLAPRVIPEVALVIVPHVLRAHPLGRLLKLVKERLDLLPGEGRPGSLDGVWGPQGKLRMPP